MTPAAFDIERFDGVFRDCGFRPDGRAYVRDGVVVRAEEGWLLAEADGPPGPADAVGHTDRPGLWKLVRDGERDVRRFELPWPAAAGSAVLGADRLPAALADVLRWMLATAGGIVPPGWRPPPARELDVADDELILTAARGRLVRRGRVELDPRRLALRLPIVSPSPDALDDGRRAWLGAVAADAQAVWRMVRMDASSGVTAEVDLSGAPSVLIGALVRAGLAVLRGVGQWLVETADLLADPSVEAEALRVCLSWVSPTRERNEAWAMRVS